jgi:predicted RNase H-like HicB family nuclease
MQYTAVIQKSAGWYLGWIEEVPGVNTQGKTLKEVKDNLKEALVMVLEANRELLLPLQNLTQRVDFYPYAKSLHSVNR